MTDPQNSRQVTAGPWGGQGIVLQVVENGATFEFDCAHGRIEKIVLGGDGKFEARGTLVREGGPVNSDEERKGQPVIFTGTLEGDDLTMVVKFQDSGEVIGNYKLKHGQTGRLRKCL